MAALKCPCPRCLLRLQIVKAPPAAVTCPRCGLHFTVAEDGSTPYEPDELDTLTDTLDATTKEVDLRSQPRPTRPRRRFPAAALGAAAMLIPAVVLGVILLRQGRPQVAPATPMPPGPRESVKAPQPPAGVAVAAQAKAARVRIEQSVLGKPIERGVAYLKASLTGRGGGAEAGARPGDVAFAGLALLSCAVPGEDPAVLHAARQVRTAAPGLRTTYDLAVCACFLDRLGQAHDRDLIRAFGLQLIAGQGRGGGWNCHCDPLEPAQRQQLLALLRGPLDVAIPVAEGPASTLPADVPVLAFHVGQMLKQPAGCAEDNFLTQFALLGVWAARKHGVPVERSLAFAAARFRASQNADGSWGYAWGQRLCEESMTCTGVLALAADCAARQEAAAPRNLAADAHVAKALVFLGEQARRGAPPGLERSQAAVKALLRFEYRTADAKERQPIEQWMQHLAQKRSIPPGMGRLVGTRSLSDLYYLWSLARVAQVYGLDKLGGKDWKGQGTEAVLAGQNADGSWSAAFPSLAETSFALLFLRHDDLLPGLTPGPGRPQR